MKRFIISLSLLLIIILGIAIILNAKQYKNETQDNTSISSSTLEIVQDETIKTSDPPILSDPLPFYYTIASQITEAERETLARLVFLEARNQSFLGQKAVVEVVFNRVLSDEFPNSIDEVIYQKNQFSPAEYIPTVTPSQIQYDVVNEVLTEIYPVLNSGVLFFSTEQYNDYLYEHIGDHYFCYSTKSYELQKGN